ncbi:MAG: hypothetical protein U1F43_21040 [Myxococcota bacterium]
MRYLLAAFALAFVACPDAKPKPDMDNEGEGESGEGEGQLAEQGQPCDDADCDADLTCVEYYGIAGPSGPKFTSCEIPCSDDSVCPDNQKCITIADGPGQVCRPATP